MHGSSIVAKPPGTRPGRPRLKMTPRDRLNHEGKEEMEPIGVES